MRNLKKILALVLALVMSLSLVTTAGAFSDDGDINANYQDAIDVLSGLDVFKGYSDGSFQPKGNITRAEVAAIIYRIATGDVTDSQASIHSTWGMFTDVADGSWYAGYVNYCANAGYIKGRGNKIFDPQATVTGYEALAMILRAVGYDKNGEFTGSNWQVRTASIGRERGILKNVTEGLLGQSASRELVAEILFRSIVIPKVDFNANTLSYVEKANKDGKKQTIGYESFKLEEITGVITGNEYADLESGETMADGRTRMVVDGADRQVYNLEYSSTLDDIGESRSAYIVNGNLSKVLVLADSGDNVVYDDGVKKSDSDAAKDKGLKLTNDTEHYRNFNPMSDVTTKVRLEYVYQYEATEYQAVSLRDDNHRTDNDTELYRVESDGTRMKINTLLKDASLTKLDRYEYRKVIPAENALTGTDESLIKTIFRIADRENSTGTTVEGSTFYWGEVYVYTSSITNREDISDVMSHSEFVKTYLQTNERGIGDNTLGHRLKVIDNNNDTIADYVLQTVYTVTKVESANTEDSKYTFKTANRDLTGIDSVNNVGKDVKTHVMTGDSLSAGDVVLYAMIDGKANAWLAETANSKIDKTDRVSDPKTVTTTDGTVYKDSSVRVWGRPKSNDSIGLGDDFADILGQTSYTLYFDLYGNVAAFNEANEEFVLLVDGWYNQTKGGIEYAVKAWIDGTIQTKDVNASGELFIQNINSPAQNNDWDQIKSLGGTTGELNNDTKDKNPTSTALRTSVALLREDGTLTPVDMAYNTLKTTGILAMDNDALPEYNSSNAGVLYRTSNRNSLGEREAYNQLDNSERTDGRYDVRALATTRYYFVYNVFNGVTSGTGRNISKVVKEYVGYQNLPDAANYESHIEDVYVVGTRSAGATDNAYYTADVVVVELDNTYYNSFGGERVFIPRFPVAINNVSLEEVQLVRENGALETVTIDLTRSNIREYDEAKGLNVGNFGTGLYYMWRASDSDVYYVQYMNHKNIADSNSYHTGVVNYSRGTTAENYTVIDTFGATRVGGIDESVDRTGTDGILVYGQINSKSDVHTSDTKYYTLSGNELKEAPKNVVMAQTPEDDMNRFGDGCIDNWNDYRLQEESEGYQLNEVLVAYHTTASGVDEIDYVISFREYDPWNGASNHKHDQNAQWAWWDCMPQTSWASIGNKWATLTRYSDERNNWDMGIREVYAAIKQALAAEKSRNEAAIKLAKTALENIKNGSAWDMLNAGLKSEVDSALTLLQNALGGIVSSIETEIKNAKDEADKAIASGDATALNKAKESLNSLLKLTSLTETQKKDIQAKIDEIDVKLGDKVTVKVSGADDADVTIGGEAVTSKPFAKNAGEVTITIKAKTGKKVLSVSDNAVKAEAADTYTVNVGETDITVMVVIGDDITPDKIDVTVDNTGKATLSSVTAGKTYTVTLKAAENVTLVDDWYTIVTDAVKGCGKIQDGTITFDYTVAADEGTNVEFTVKKEKLIGGENDKELLRFELVGADAKFVPYKNYSYNPATRAFSEEIGGEEGKVYILKIGGEELKTVWRDGGYVVMFATAEEAITEINRIMNQDPDPETGLLTMAAPVAGKNIEGDATINTKTGEINLNLGQPQAVGAKLPTEIVIDNTITATIEWDPNDPYAMPGVEYEYKVTYVKAAEGVAAEDLPATMTVTKGEGENKEVLVEDITANDVTTGKDVEEGTIPPAPPATLDEIKAKAVKTVEGYRASEIAELTGVKKTVASTAKTDALAAIEKAETEPDVEKAVADYKATVDDPAILGEDPLTSAREIASAEINDYRAAEIEKKDEATKAELETAKQAALDAVLKAAEDAEIQAARDAYEKAVDEKLGERDAVDITLRLAGRGFSRETVKVNGRALEDSYLTVKADKDETSGKYAAVFTVEVPKYYKVVLNKGEAVKQKDDGTVWSVSVETDVATTVTATIQAGLTVEKYDGEPIKFAQEVNGKKPSDIQGDITIAYEDGGNVIKVSGTVKPVNDWTAWGSANGDWYYYAALKLSCDSVAPTAISVKSGLATTFKPLTNDEKTDDGADEAGQYGIVVKRLELDAMNVAKSFTAKADGREFTIDLSGLTSENLSVVTTKETKLFKDGDVKEIQKDIVVTPSQDGTTFKVSGTSKLTDLGDSFSSVKTLQTGYFIALDLNFPGVETAKSIKITNYKVDGNTRDYTEAKSGDTLVWRITKTDLNKNRPIIIEACGKKYTVDLTDVNTDNGGRDLEVRSAETTDLTETSGKVYGKDITDIQSNITATRTPGTNTWVVSGQAKWTKNWTEAFSGEEAHGYYVALELEHPDAASAKNIKYVSNNPEDNASPAGTKSMKSGDVLVWRIDSEKREKNIEVTVGAQKYKIDVSQIELVSPAINVKVLDEKANVGLITNDKKTVGDLQSGISVMEGNSGNKQVSGTVYFNTYDGFGGSSHKELDTGYYIDLGIYTESGETAKIEYQKIDEPTKGDWGVICEDGKTGDTFVWHVAKADGVKKNLTLKAYDRIWEIDMSKLTLDTKVNLEKTKAETVIGKDISQVQVQDGIDGIKVTREGDTFKVSGTLKSVETFGNEFSSNEKFKKGFFVALDLNLGGVEKANLCGSPDTGHEPELKNDTTKTIVIIVADSVGNFYANRTIAIKDNNNKIVKEYTIDTSKLILEGVTDAAPKTIAYMDTNTVDVPNNEIVVDNNMDNEIVDGTLQNVAVDPDYKDDRF